MEMNKKVHITNQSDEEESFLEYSPCSELNKYLNIGLSMERYEYLNI